MRFNTVARAWLLAEQREGVTMAEEAAFLESMQAANELGVEYKADGGGAQQHAESDSEEYDPSQAVQTELPPSNAQDPNVPSSSLGPTSHHKLPSALAAPLTSTFTSTLLPQQDLSASDCQSLSRSMSRASSQSKDNDAIIQTPYDSNNIEAGHTQEGRKVGQSEGNEDVDMGQELSVPSVSGPDLNISTNGVSADNVAIQNDVQDQSYSSTVQNGTTDTVPNLAAVIPNTGGSSHGGPTAKPTETLPAPLVTDARAAAKAQPPTPSTSAPRARLPHDTLGILEDRIKEDTRGDMQAWLHLINEHKKRGKMDGARSVYERFLAVFPSAVRCVLKFATHIQRHADKSSRARNGFHTRRWRTKLKISMRWR